MSLKRHFPLAEGAEAARCVEEAQPAFKKLRISDSLQSFHGIDVLQPDQQTSAPTTPGMAGQAENKGTQYPMNTLLRQLHMERMQRLKSLVGSSLSSTPH